MDLHSFFADPDPAVCLNADPDPGGKMNAAACSGSLLSYIYTYIPGSMDLGSCCGSCGGSCGSMLWIAAVLILLVGVSHLLSSS